MFKHQKKVLKEYPKWATTLFNTFEKIKSRVPNDVNFQWDTWRDTLNIIWWVENVARKEGRKIFENELEKVSWKERQLDGYRKILEKTISEQVTIRLQHEVQKLTIRENILESIENRLLSMEHTENPPAFINVNAMQRFEKVFIKDLHYETPQGKVTYEAIMDLWYEFKFYLKTGELGFK